MADDAGVLCDAALRSDIVKVKAILARSPELVNARIGDGLTPLHSSVYYGTNPELIEYLISKGAEVDSHDVLGLTPLHWSASRNNRKAAEVLLSKRADINSRERNGLTPLHMAAFNGHRDMMDLLLSRGASIDLKANDGYTPLHMAACNGFLDLVRFLLSKGADINAKTNSGFTPMNIAVNSNKMDVADFLKKFGGKDTKELELERKKQIEKELKLRDMREFLVKMYYEKK